MILLGHQVIILIPDENGIHIYILNELHKKLKHNRMEGMDGGGLGVNDNHDKNGINNDVIENNRYIECMDYLNILLLKN